MLATQAGSQRSMAPTPGYLGMAFAFAVITVMSILLAAALAADPQQKASAEDAQRLLHECATHYQRGEMQEALAACNGALPTFRAVGDRWGEAASLNNIGLIYSSLGEKQKALEHYQQALPVVRALGDRGGEAVTLNNIGMVYDDLGEKQKALEYYQQALPIERSVGDREGEATTLNNIGMVYGHLGENQKALEYFQQALPMERAMGDRWSEATTLNNIGLVYSLLGEKQKALEYYQQSLLTVRALGDRRDEATTLNNIGMVYAGLGENQKALEYFQQALPIERSVGDREGEATTLNNIGMVYNDLREKQKALDYYNQALPLRRAVGDRAGEAITLGNIEFTLQRSDPNLAIVFGKQAVNILQSIRRDNKGLQESLRASYEKSIESYFRFLADLLVERGRFGEAEEVLNLLKDKEASDFIRRDSVSDQLHAATLLDPEKRALDHYDQIVNQIVDLGQRKTALLAKVGRDHVPLSPAELQEENRLNDDLKAAKAVLLKYFEELQKSFPSDSALARRVTDFKDTAGLQDKLQKLGPDVVAIYTLVTPDKYVALLVTSGARKAYTSTLKVNLNNKVFDFRQKLQDPTSDPLPLAQELYHIIFPEGLRQDLDSMHAKTIMWSIDSTLRYIPFSALHDGKQYLVETFRQSLITPASIPNLTEDPVRHWSGEGFGVSEGNSPLPSVPAELRGIFRETPDGKSPVPGVVRLNAAFTWQNFKNDLRQSPKAVVHIATHYDSRPGVAANSQLLMGDGERSLADLASEDKLFHGVDLLTLSACNTGFTNRSEDGREVDSFGEIAQQLEAKGVIASLWSVNDDSTSSLMQTMYRLRQQTKGMTKDEALRQAQLALLTGKLKPATAQPVPGRSVVPNGPQTARRPPPTDWSHPYFWAPFILIGNWK
jgi:CHAT domain-containing protein/tetratricopeptide (TPR) repeat protein